jgi:sirohydrochlorin cobaltochelatase
VDQQDFKLSAVILAGHGSTLNTDSSLPVFKHAAELRRRNIFAEVREGFWKQEPQILRVLQELQAMIVYVVPVFISEGHFSENVIPEALGFGRLAQDSARVRYERSRRFIYCRPIGSHPSMTEVLIARASDVIAKAPFPRAPAPKETTLCICGHGTDQNETSRLAVDRQVQLIRERRIYAAVDGVFMEEEPRIANCLAMAQTRNIVVVPFFISDGLHTQQDIPILLGEPKNKVEQRLLAGQPTWRNPTERNGKLVWYSSSIGSEPLIVDVILERIREASKWP